ncbi:MAG: YhcH/YjgK/YiaL family protein [Chloroflexi bacterium HGW-Chloroflexi-5]|jgi:YhcH/YjgK/YiaL family protein|nr:MAG: YhcH/YjgK/YiaL family protein [Chloroflexi bacterium HGW-Chloroflexi-5]
MIYDMLSNSNLYAGITPRLKTAFDYLTYTDLVALPVGRINLDGDQVYVLVQEYLTKRPDQGFWESHRRYMDVQYIQSGCERIDYALLNTMTLGDYAQDRDFQAMTGIGSPLTLSAGSFAVFFPQDAHMPGLACGMQLQVKKVVVKCEL